MASAAAAKFAKKIRLPPLPSVRDIVRMYKLRAMRELSQNFLLEERVTDRIVRATGGLTDAHVLEVGPGPGSITRSILKDNPASLVVVEKDPRFVPTLEMLADSSKIYGIDLRVVVGDIMHTDMSALFPSTVQPRTFDEQPPDVHIVGNLPFNVSTILIIRWLEAISERKNAWRLGRCRMTLTFQKEVAERIVAPIVSKQRCRMSLMCQNWCKVSHKFTISGGAFVPRPDVDVGVVTFTPRKHPVIPLGFKTLEKLFRQVFHNKQKYAITPTKMLFPPEVREPLAKELFERADLNPQIRAIQITIEEFKRLAYAYDTICANYPGMIDYNYRACKAIPREKFFELQE